MRCWLGWHKVRLLDTGPYYVKQGCDRCGRVRVMTRTAIGGTRKASPWT
jgi:hypothetical protein